MRRQREIIDINEIKLLLIYSRQQFEVEIINVFSVTAAAETGK